MILAYMRSPPGADELVVAVGQNLVLPFLLFVGIRRLNRLWGQKPGKLTLVVVSLGVGVPLALNQHLIPLFLITAVLILFGMETALRGRTERSEKSLWICLALVAILGILSLLGLHMVESSARERLGTWMGIPDFGATGIVGVLLWSAAVPLFFAGPLLSARHSKVRSTGLRAFTIANGPFVILVALGTVGSFLHQQRSLFWESIGEAMLMSAVFPIPFAAWFGWAFSAILARSFVGTQRAWWAVHATIALAYLSLQFYFFWSVTDYWSPFGQH